MVVANFMVVITKWHVHREVATCSSDRYIEESTLFLNAFGSPRCHVGRKVSVSRVDDVDCIELKSLR
jgi:hypothetical protein